MSRLNLLYKMDGLLNQCKACPKPYGAPEVKCKGCHIYEELRGIGNQLGRVEKMTLTKEKYTDLKAKGLTDAEIAKQEGVAQATEKKVTELEHLHCACDDLEKESARYREERNEWQKEYFGALERLKQSDSLVIQQSKVIENTKKTLENLTKENIHLKGLVLLEWGK